MWRSTSNEVGSADVGIVGKDVLLEEAPGADVYEVMDLGIGCCRMAVAGIAEKSRHDQTHYDRHEVPAHCPKLL